MHRGPLGDITSELENKLLRGLSVAVLMVSCGIDGTAVGILRGDRRLWPQVALCVQCRYLGVGVPRSHVGAQKWRRTSNICDRDQRLREHDVCTE
jgi:hypothetical protein